jgi:hypothetical protein
MIELMLGQPIVDSRAVYECASFLELARYTHLLAKPAMRSAERVLTWTGMSATRVSPEATAVVFPVGAPLKENISVVVTDEDRECAMKLSVTMSIKLRRCANRPILLVDENYRFIQSGHDA